MADNGNEVLYLKYRPKNFKELIGQDKAVEVLQDMGKRGAIPHAILLTGPSGCGKTTIARILREKLKCHDADFHEQNCANARGIDDMRAIESTMRISPMKSGGVKVYLLDECHQITPDAQGSLLKVLEDTPSHVYFFLATTDPQKLKPTIKSRCTEIACRALTAAEVIALVERTAAAEGKAVPGAVAAKIADCAEGGARKALVLLHAVIGIADERAQLEYLEKADVQAAAIDICRALMNGKTTWKDMTAILAKVEEDPEGIRHAVLGYCKAVLLKSESNRAMEIIDQFQFNFYDSKMPGLVAACYRVIRG